MPVDPELLSSQGTTVTFAGSDVGSLLGVSVTSGTAKTSNVTSAESPVVGTGSESRIFTSLDCTAVDPGAVSIRLLGMPGWTIEDIGSRGTLAVDAPSGTLSADAILESFEFEAAVGDLIKGSANFVFTGE